MLAKGWRLRILPRLTSSARLPGSDALEAGNHPPSDKSRDDNHLGRDPPAEDSPSGRESRGVASVWGVVWWPPCVSATSLGLLVARLSWGRCGRGVLRHAAWATADASASSALCRAELPPRGGEPGRLRGPHERPALWKWEAVPRPPGEGEPKRRSTRGDGRARRPGLCLGFKHPLPNGPHPTRSSSYGILDCSA